MGSKSLLTVLWLVGTIVAATVAWQSLGFVSASTEGELASHSPPTSNPSTMTSTLPPTSATPGSRDETFDGSSEPGDTTGTANTTTSTLVDTGPPDRAIEQTFDLIGGRTAIRFSSTEVAVVWATPNDGYTVESYPEDGGVEVEFSNGVHESKVEAWWADGPRFETRERDD